MTGSPSSIRGVFMYGGKNMLKRFVVENIEILTQMFLLVWALLILNGFVEFAINLAVPCVVLLGLLAVRDG